MRLTSFSLARLIPIIFLLVCCGHGDQNGNYPVSKGDRNIWESDSMRPPVPVVVDSPDRLSTVKAPEGTFLILVRKSDNVVFFNGDTIICANIARLDSLIDVHGSEALNDHIVLQADVNGLSPDINSIIDLLQEKKIIRFHLITDLEK